MPEPSKAFLIGPCRPQEYRELTGSLGRWFGHSGDYFPRHYAHIFQADPRFIRRNLVCRAEGRLVGCVGIYPLRLRVQGVELKVGGVGSVSTDPAWRGRGVMRALLQVAIAQMATEGCDLSWLQGDRFRYGNYGWEIGGEALQFYLRADDLKKRLGEVAPLRLRTAGKSDIPSLMRSYQHLETRALRDRGLWERHFTRDWPRFHLGSAGGKTGYALTWQEEAPVVWELQAPPALLSGLLLGVMKQKKSDHLYVHYPEVQDQVSSWLHAHAANFNRLNCSQFRIVRADLLWRKLLPEFRRQCAAPAAAMALRTVTAEADRRLVLHRLFSHLEAWQPLPSRLKALECLQPVRWWMSRLDHV